MLNKIVKYIGLTLSIVTLTAAASAVSAKPYSPFGAKLPARLVGVKSASVISVEAETWPGFTRVFTISLAGIQMPEHNSAAALCERELAKKALAFVEDFLAETQDIELRDMKMENSAQQEAEADIGTGKGSLVQALISQGLARPDSTDPGKSWCR
ncbi:MAG: hypothetical protein ACU85E_06420 [Gammaproteobacteria bacterium]